MKCAHTGVAVRGLVLAGVIVYACAFPLSRREGKKKIYIYILSILNG